MPEIRAVGPFCMSPSPSVARKEAPRRDDWDLGVYARGDVPFRRHGRLLPRGAETEADQGQGKPASADGERGRASAERGATELSRDEVVGVLHTLSDALTGVYGNVPTQPGGGREPDALAALLALTDPARICNPKLEIRRAAPRLSAKRLAGAGRLRPGRVAQVALCARTPQERAVAHRRVTDAGGLGRLDIVLGGEVTLEVAAPGVSKAVPCHFVSRHFERILAAMEYGPGPRIDARARRTVVLSDADGTLYDKQETCPDDALGANLGNSPVRASLVAYLRAGGVLGVCTGNDLQRTSQRLLAGLPEGDRAVLLRRIFISANGGASLAVYGPDGALGAVEGYGDAADPDGVEGTFSGGRESGGVRDLDAVYLGDDARMDGNDMQAFRVFGPRRSICVSNADTERLPASLRRNHIEGETQGTARFLDAVMTGIAVRPDPSAPVFTQAAIDAAVQRAAAGCEISPRLAAG